MAATFTSTTGKRKPATLSRSTPYFEEEPSLSTDDKQIVCTFVDPNSHSSGLEIVDLERGTYRLLLKDRFAGDTHPIFSPSGLHIAFTHYGSGWESPLAVDARRYLCEVDLRTGEVSDLVKKHAYSYIENPLYLDEDHLVFRAEFDSNYGRDSNDVFATYTRGRGVRNLTLSEWSNLYFLAYSRANDSFFARVTISEQQEQIDIISRKDLNAPKSWLRTPVHYEHPPSWQERETNLAYQAAYSPGTGEILTLTENAHDYTINAISFRNNKASIVLTLPK